MASPCSSNPDAPESLLERPVAALSEPHSVRRAPWRRAIRWPGDGIAFVGDAGGVPRAYYARLAGARVVGNIDDPAGAFWRLAPGVQSGRLALLRARSGARIAVSDEAAARSAPGWIPVTGSGDSYRILATR